MFTAGVYRPESMCVGMGPSISGIECAAAFGKTVRAGVAILAMQLHLPPADMFIINIFPYVGSILFDLSLDGCSAGLDVFVFSLAGILVKRLILLVLNLAYLSLHQARPGPTAPSHPFPSARAPLRL